MYEINVRYLAEQFNWGAVDLVCNGRYFSCGGSTLL